MKKIEVEGLNLFYGDFQALQDIRMSVREKAITALIGSSGCGKSTLLRCLNRMNDLIEEVRIEGSVKIDGVLVLPAIEVNTVCAISLTPKPCAPAFSRSTRTSSSG